MPTRIILVRLGQSIFNAENCFRSCSDNSILTKTGRLTAYQTGLALSSISFDAAYVSPLQPAQATAQEIFSTIDEPKFPVHSHPNLKEIHLPQGQELPYQDGKSHFAAVDQQWQDALHQLQMEFAHPTPWPDAPSEARSAQRSDSRSTAIATIPSSKTWVNHSAITLNRKSTVLDSPSSLANTASVPDQLYSQAEQFWREILPKHSDQTLLIIADDGMIRALISTAIGLDSRHYHSLQQSNSSINQIIFNQLQKTAQLQSLNLSSHLGETLPELNHGKHGTRMILLPIDNKSCHIMPLNNRLQSVPLHGCMTDGSDDARLMATMTLSQHPQYIIQLENNQSNFLQNWHQKNQAMMGFQSGLTTMLVIAHINEVTSFLHHVLELPKYRKALAPKSGTLSILHYPGSREHPVLQAMNLRLDAIAH